MSPGVSGKSNLGSAGKIKIGLGVQLFGFLSLIAVGSLLLLAVIHFHQLQQYRNLFDNQAREEEERLTFQIEQQGMVFKNFVYDYTYWDEMVAYVRKPKTEWATTNLDSVLPSFRVDAVWILNPHYEVLHSATLSGERLALPLNKADLETLLQKDYFWRIFVSTPEGLMELRSAPIQPSADTSRVTEPKGWMLAGRYWSKELIGSLEQGSGLRLQLSDLEEFPHTSDFNSARIAFAIELMGKEGNEVAHLHAIKYIPIIAKFIRTNRNTVLVIGLFSLCISLLIMAVFYSLVIRPLGKISRSIEKNDPSLLHDLAVKQDEMGKLARQILIAHSNREQAAFESEWRRETENKLDQSQAEREEFARELHDDTLQALFATGISVESAASQLETKEPDLSLRLKKVVSEINRTMTSLRVAISGLEGRRIDPVRLEAILHRMLETSAQSETLKVDCHLDPEALKLLSREQGFHLVRVLREAISNTIKHSRATHFQVALATEKECPVLTIQDNGVGFNMKNGSQGGHGLNNIRERVRQLGGHFELYSSPGSGLRIVLKFDANEKRDS